MSDETADNTRETPLTDEHRGLGARMVPFAGYAMPVQYPAGILAEHRQTREAAGIFDVSHMGQVIVRADDPAALIERLVPGDIRSLGTGEMRYSLLMNDAGGIRDDLIVTRRDDHLFIVVNAGCKDADLAYMVEQLGAEADIEMLEDRALIALQGPQAAAVMARQAEAATALTFMTSGIFDLDGVECWISRSGYTGEDGFEISVPAAAAVALWRRLLDQPEVGAIGLGARDSLRLEAGLCLYGHDIDETTSPVEAGLMWSIGKRRREEGGYPGADRVARELAEGASRRRVGLKPEGRAPVREGTVIRDAEGAETGTVTSGGFGPTVGGPVAMGYVARDRAAAGTGLTLDLRGRAVPATVAKMPFVPQRYHRG
ncbi:glycine cleavage system aminomethyltransferase GcvT [Oceanibacterium hippocampi]|uniref:aminomethyltransferase n=1 Tax=Oceanibacterium hippocampi TaxID=745714 RepID=A0A1Y5S6Q0_9PROT|nr:glycine cleavage system aminomethyltransferase GcvT [Oceanibacterium hippocampi]SLN33736.1 Aminomethyltransferase [Oceanibacterium hippocampi]